MSDVTSEVSWSSVTVDIVEGGLSEVPYVGHILSDLVPTLWPSADNSVWWEVEKQVAALIDQEISQEVYDNVDLILTGLSDTMNNWNDAVATNDVSYIQSNWASIRNIFTTDLPQFQAPGYEILLLPLFAQAVNLYLSLMRDGAIGAVSWGWSQDTQNTIISELSEAIPPYVSYAKQYFEEGVQKVTKQAPTDHSDCQPFAYINSYVRQLTLTVSDYAQLWPFFDISHYPNGITVYLGREIYSDPVGTTTNSGNIVLPGSPNKPPDIITVWAWDRIDAVQLTYPSGQGPGAVTTTARMGDSDGGSDQSGHGGVFQVQNNPVVLAEGHAGDILNAFSFQFQDGTSSGHMGGTGGTGFAFSYDNHILSSIHINGVSDYYGSADCAVFGFKYQEPTNVSGTYLRIPIGWNGA